MYINEVKRDKETLKKISEFQSSIENLVSAATTAAAAFSRPHVHSLVRRTPCPSPCPSPSSAAPAGTVDNVCLRLAGPAAAAQLFPHSPGTASRRADVTWGLGLCCGMVTGDWR